ncbi:MAG: NAD(P)/FAD-dependent oxidoreductase [Gammaproteobacteria bacterium]|nr:NAD(P)/FAD-dependent oxidoreductase [Gammaproteobacteria bacterium]
MDTTDAVVIGAGVIGLAIARELAARGRDTLILEADARFGTGASSRNSEVIHAGIYYPPGSLKARLCVAGRDALYGFCAARGIGHRRCGKLIVATDATQLPRLAAIAATARANGVELEVLEDAAARALEPELACAAALHSPLTGIIDAHAYMQALLADAEQRGALLVCNCRVTRVVLEEQSLLLAVNGAEPALRARMLINCAGVDAPALARLIEGFPARHVPREYFCKGNYFALSGRSPFRRLIYPLPEEVGLGTHLTLDLAGAARFGPDVEWVDRCDYEVNPKRAERFYAAVRRYWPGLPAGSLLPAYAGIRPRITGPGEADVDFRIDDAGRHGVAGVVNLFGIESPGLTASLALAGDVAARVS